MLTGSPQAIDSVLVKANAAMSSMAEKAIMDDADRYAQELKENEENVVKSSSDDDEQKGDKPTNQTHGSTTDPDSRMATKPGKMTRLNYLSQVSVDTSSHIITHIQAFHADKRDSQCLDMMLNQVTENLQEAGLQVREVIADTNYSSSQALKSLNNRSIVGYIPSFGGYKPARTGFVYDQDRDSYYCPQGKELTLSGYRHHHGTHKIYLSKRKDCKDCPIRSACLRISQQKMITHTLSKPLFDQMHQRVTSDQGKVMMRLRQTTVEPVIGSLVEYTGMGKVFTKGLKLANKCMLMAGMAYNLKKMIKRDKNSVFNSMVGDMLIAINYLAMPIPKTGRNLRIEFA